MDVQQSLFQQLQGLIPVKSVNIGWKRLENAISLGGYDDVYACSFFLYVCLLGTKFHEKLTPALFVLCTGVVAAFDSEETKLQKQFLKGIEKISASEKKKIIIARAFKNFVEIETSIKDVLESKSSPYSKLFRSVLLLIPVADEAFKDDLLDLAKFLEEKRILQQTIECVMSVKKGEAIDFSQPVAALLIAKVRELQVVANFLQRNSPLTQDSLPKYIELYGVTDYYVRRKVEIQQKITVMWERILDAFEDYPKSTIRMAYIEKLQARLEID